MFIAFEGLDGSGSSTQARMLAGRLNAENYSVLETKEPTNNIIGGIIRAALTRDLKFTPDVLQLLFTADRGNHLDKEIEPALKDGKIVITDRYMMSTFAFGLLEVDDRDWLLSLNKKFRKPDITFLLKVAPCECVRRIKKRGQKIELFEEEQKLEKIWKNYESFVGNFDNVHIIDSEQPLEVVKKEVWAEIEKRLKKDI